MLTINSSVNVIDLADKVRGLIGPRAVADLDWRGRGEPFALALPESVDESRDATVADADEPDLWQRDLTGAVQLALGDADWRKFFLEGQLFVAGIYFVACFAMSRYSRWLEAHLNTGTRRQ